MNWRNNKSWRSVPFFLTTKVTAWLPWILSSQSHCQSTFHPTGNIDVHTHTHQVQHLAKMLTCSGVGSGNRTSSTVKMFIRIVPFPSIFSSESNGWTGFGLRRQIQAWLTRLSQHHSEAAAWGEASGNNPTTQWPVSRTCRSHCESAEKLIRNFPSEEIRFIPFFFSKQKEEKISPLCSFGSLAEYWADEDIDNKSKQQSSVAS